MKGNSMRGKQRGITLIGFIISLVVVCIFAYMAMQLGPAYNEYMGVKKAMDFVANNTTPTDSDMLEIAKMLDKQFNVGYVDNVTGSQAKLLRDRSGNVLQMKYEVRKPFVSNIEFVLTFDYKVKLGGGKVGKVAGD